MYRRQNVGAKMYRRQNVLVPKHQSQNVSAPKCIGDKRSAPKRQRQNSAVPLGRHWRWLVPLHSHNKGYSFFASDRDCGRHFIMKNAHSIGYFNGAPCTSCDFPQLPVHRVKRLWQIDEGYTEIHTRFPTLLLELTGYKNHVDCASLFLESTLELRTHRVCNMFIEPYEHDLC